MVARSPRTQNWIQSSVAGALAAGLLAASAYARPLPATPEALQKVNLALEERGLPPVPAEALRAESGEAALLLAVDGAPGGLDLEARQRVRAPLTDAAADRHDPSDAAVAAARGLTVDQLLAIRSQRTVDNRQILTLPSPRLERFLYRLENPKQSPAGYFEWRNSFYVDETGTVPEGAVVEAFLAARQMPLDPRLLPAAPAEGRTLLAPVKSSTWTWKGPGNIGGRIRALLIHPTQPDRIWAGAAGGGIWYTSNAGASWAPVNDFLPNLAVCALAMDPTNSNVLYAGTGESTPNADAIRGVGIFKSTDGGVIWNLLPSTTGSDFSYVSTIALSPNGATLLAATSAGILRSTNGGTTWTKTLSSGTRYDVAFHPTDSTRAISSSSGSTGFAWSADGGLTWTNSTLPNASGRVEAAYARSSPSTVYAMSENRSGQSTGFYRSTDGGVTFTAINLGGNANVDGDQGWYDFDVWVDPTNANRLLLLGIDVWRTNDAGATMTNITNVYSGGAQHPDMHIVAQHPGYNGTTNRIVYIGNDGGVTRQADVVTATSSLGWTKLNNNLGVTQFYGASGNPASGMLIGGTQDNGTLRLLTGSSATGSWSSVVGGDGGYTLVDQQNPTYVYASTQNLGLRRSTNGGSSFSTFTTGITGSPEFIACYALDPNNSNTLLYATEHLNRSTGARTGTAFTSIKAPVSGSHKITAIAVAPGNSNRIWVGHNSSGGVWTTTNGTAATPTWTQVGVGTLPSRRVTRFAIDPTNNDRVVVAFGGFGGGEYLSVRQANNIWLTTNGGTTWTNIHGNLPLAPIYTVVMQPGTPQTLYVGTDAGIYASSVGGTTWSGTNIGPSTASVVELFWLGLDLVAATHGRGLFQTGALNDTTGPLPQLFPDFGETHANPIPYRVRFGETVSGLAQADFSASNATVGAPAAAGSDFAVAVTPTAADQSVTVQLSAGAVEDFYGNGSVAAAALPVLYKPASPYFLRSNFDPATAPGGWEAAGDWQHGVPTAGVGPGSARGGSGRCFGTVLTGSYTSNATSTLTSPPLALPASPARPYRLRFWMWLNAESTRDGGLLEVSANGGAFTTVPGASLSLPYNGTVQALGASGWTGAGLAGWNLVRLDLTPYHGQTVQFRFRFAADASVAFPGWYIDDFAIETDPQVNAPAAPIIAVEGAGPTPVAFPLNPVAASPITVGITPSGAPQAGTDYTLSASPAGAAEGASAVVVNVTPTLVAGTLPRLQTLFLSLAGGTGYTVGPTPTATIYLIGDGGYDAWRRVKFSAADLANPAVSGPEANPTGDGVSNVLRFALGIDPFAPSANRLPKTRTVEVNGQRFLEVELVRGAGTTNLGLTGEVTGNFTSWSSAPAHVSVTSSAGPGPGETTLVFRDLTPVTEAQPRGLRIRSVLQ